MRPSACWCIENYRYERCVRPWDRFRSLVSLHNHSNYSAEDLASLNAVSRLWFMRPFRGTLQAAFGFRGIPDFDYGEIHYHPPHPPEDVLRMEIRVARKMGFSGVSLAITDHDEIAGGIELLGARPPLDSHIALGEELSIRFQDRRFHLGITGLRESRAESVHRRLQDTSRSGRLDELFDVLRDSGCLVVLNHPLIPWREGVDPGPPAVALLERHGSAIHALEYNGMRRKEENDAVIQLARRFGKPVVGGGDSHLLVGSSVLSGSDAADFSGFVEEVKSGHATTLVRDHYFAPLGWKLTLRTLAFIAHYREIASFQGVPIREALARRRVLLDPVGLAARAFLNLVFTLGLER